MSDVDVTVIAPLQHSTAAVLIEVARERRAQDTKWGQQNHPDGTGPNEYWMYDDPEGGTRLADDVRRDVQKWFAEGQGNWLMLLLEEVAEAFAEDDPAKLRAELVQVAAVAVAWVEAIDRRTAANG